MLLILCGKSGSGKDTIAQNILEKYAKTKKIVSTTTRPMRDGELNGREYDFISKADFLEGIENNLFIEYRAYNTLAGNKPDKWFYGTRKFEKTGSDSLLIAIKDLEGAKVIKKYCEEIKEPCLCIMLKVDDKEREERAKLRGSFDQTEWDRRYQTDKVDFSKEKQVGIVDEVVNNNNGCSVEKITDICYLSSIRKLEEKIWDN